jgi:O-antigen biosynthesis protein
VRFSVIIPVFHSHTTIERCLRGLERLEHSSFEVILVDSSPDNRSADIIARFPRFRLIRSGRRLMMHAARNVALPHATGRTIVCLDPDCIPDPDWLTRLEEALDRGHRVVGGGISCHPSGAVNLAAHIVKFWRWFPGNDAGPIEDLPTANLAVDREALEAAGAFSEAYIAGDTELCHRLRRTGIDIHFDGRAVVQHIHEATFGSLMSERFRRGIDFAVMRAASPEWNRVLSLLTVAGAPVLALRQFYWKFKASAGHGYLGGFLAMAPVILCCDVAWMSGVALGKVRSLRRQASPT